MIISARRASMVGMSRAAARFRQHDGRHAFMANDDHKLAAPFALNCRHERLFIRVLAELTATSDSSADRVRAIEP
ncbi:MAG: hypothetical protein HY056_14765 [Proteobacteria bacterium]|nr:hypothetical protein [Pseudomonadota bacterium]